MHICHLINSYYLNKHLVPEDSEYNIQTSFDDNLKRKYRDHPGDTPWWDTHSFNIPGARRLFCPSGVGVTTTGDLNASNTTPFSVTLGAGVTLEQIAEAVDVGDLLMARSGTNYEIMNVNNNCDQDKLVSFLVDDCNMSMNRVQNALKKINKLI